MATIKKYMNCGAWLPAIHVAGRAQLLFRNDREGVPDLNVC